MIPLYALKRFKPIGLIMITVIFIEIVLLSYLFQRDIITLQAHYFFVFVIGNLLICSYLFYATTPKQAYYLPLHIFLWLFLCYSHHSLLFYSAGAVFSVASVFYISRTSFPATAKGFFYMLAISSLGAAIVFEPALLFMVCTGYMVIMVFDSTSISKMLKWNITIVTMLHILAILGNSKAIIFPYQENTIFTLPVSFIIFVCIVLKDHIASSFYSLLFAPSIAFLFVANVLFGYSLASYQLVYNEENMFAQYWAISIVLGILSFLMCWYTHYVTTSKYEQLQAQLDAWFENKYEDAISQYEKEISWSGFESKLAKLLPNDGIKIIVNEQTLFSSGCFLDQTFSAGKMIHTGGTVALYIHETNTHMAHTPSNYYTALALVHFLEHKLGQWQEISKLKMSFAEPSGDFGKDLKFRQDVTYYLHDNILQNIIATKNIIGSLSTEQAALKELAVETLTELNSSIRSQMHEIYPSTLADLSFERNIHILLDEMRKRYGYIPTPHITYELVERMDEPTAYLFYRTLQELFTNTCKYAQADNIWVHLYADRDWILEVREDGIPIKEEDMEIKIKHLGISSLKQQASSLQGVFEMKQMDGQKIFKLTIPRSAYENTIV